MTKHQQRVAEVYHFFNNQDTVLGFRKLLDCAMDTQNMEIYREAIELTDWKEKFPTYTEELTEKSKVLLSKIEKKVASKKDFYAFIKSSDENLKLWSFILEDLVLQQMEREKDLLINSPKERYERVLRRSPQLFQEIPNKHIANYLRMSPETLSRLKKS